MKNIWRMSSSQPQRANGHRENLENSNKSIHFYSMCVCWSPQACYSSGKSESMLGEKIESPKNTMERKYIEWNQVRQESCSVRNLNVLSSPPSPPLCLQCCMLEVEQTNIIIILYEIFFCISICFLCRITASTLLHTNIKNHKEWSEIKTDSHLNEVVEKRV